MDQAEAYTFISERLAYDAGRFYGEYDHLSLGRGLIYRGIAYPTYVGDVTNFATVEGIVYVISHECDVSQDNIRPFNDDILICPLMPFEEVVNGYQSTYGEPALRTWLANLAKGKLFRLVYFPRIKDCLQFGAVMFLNQMCSTKVQAFSREGAERVAALGDGGLWYLEGVLRNHFLRPKAEMWGNPVFH